MPDDESVRADAATTSDETLPERPADAPADAGRRRTILQAAAVVVALGLFVWALQGYLSASSDRSDVEDEVQVRNEVQVAANNAVEVLNTLDERDVDAGLDAWADVSTGDLQEELTDLTQEQRDTLSEVARISEGTVVSSAVTRLDADAGSASVICFVEKSVGDTPDAVAEASPSRIQFTVDLLEEDGTWLVTTLTPVAVVTPEGEDAP